MINVKLQIFIQKNKFMQMLFINLKIKLFLNIFNSNITFKFKKILIKEFLVKKNLNILR